MDYGSQPFLCQARPKWLQDSEVNEERDTDRTHGNPDPGDSALMIEPVEVIAAEGNLECRSGRRWSQTAPASHRSEPEYHVVSVACVAATVDRALLNPGIRRGP